MRRCGRTMYPSHHEAYGHRRNNAGTAERVELGSGFSLIEVMIAAAIVALAIAATALVMTRAFAAISTSTSAQEATELADAVLAQDEALPWNSLKMGLSSTSDPSFALDEAYGNIYKDSSTNAYCFEQLPLIVGGTTGTCSTPWTGRWANPAVGTSCPSSVAPASGNFPPAFLPHEQCVRLNQEGTTFEVSVYPTGTALGAEEEELTVVVSWGAAGANSGEPTHVSASVNVSCGATAGLPQRHAKC